MERLQRRVMTAGLLGKQPLAQQPEAPQPVATKVQRPHLRDLFTMFSADLLARSAGKGGAVCSNAAARAACAPHAPEAACRTAALSGQHSCAQSMQLRHRTSCSHA